MPETAPPGHVADPSHLVAADVTFAGADGDELRGFHVRPEGPGPLPGLLVIHEAFGLNEHIRDVATRFANAGFDVLAPDLYSREGTPDDFQAIMALMRSLPDGRVVSDLEGAVAYLRAGPENNGRVGCIGFCSGGRQTLLLACSSSQIQAAVDCWGGSIDRADPDNETTPARPVPVIDLCDHLHCPLMVVIGAEDTNPSPEVGEELRRRLEAVDQPVRVEVYEEAGHAFFADYRPQYRPKAAQRLWDAVVPWLHEHLDQTVPRVAAPPEKRGEGTPPT
jgi:carboxymethylenebutenolidase